MVEPARQWYRQASALAAELGMRPLSAHCHVGLARVDDRAHHLARAMELYREMQMAS